MSQGHQVVIDVAYALSITCPILCQVNYSLFHLRPPFSLLTLDGVRLYHAGDTDFIPEMKKIKADIALLPVSGTYVMTADEAAEAALAIHPKCAIPMHYGAIVGSAEDAKTFADRLNGKVDVRILPQEIN